MKKTEENRYPHSADLFKFCKEALNIKHNFEVKVIDQHVGSILGYDPADCSHWKKGKKNIKSLQAINTIASQLEVDPNFVTDIVSGRVDLEESIQEYKGFGSSQLSSKAYEEFKREYFKNPSRYSQSGETRSFDQVIDLQRENSLEIVQKLLERASVKTPPVMLPELLEALPNIRFSEEENEEKGLTWTTRSEENGEVRYTIHFRKGEMKPHVRYLMAREIGRVMLNPQLTEVENEEILNAKLNLFASLLLVPGHLLQAAVYQLDETRDMVNQLADMFWVSRTIMNSRFKDFISFGN